MMHNPYYVHTWSRFYREEGWRKRAGAILISGLVPAGSHASRGGWDSVG